ncbi:MAG: amidohydrolase [Tissierellia bacterium]|nr:amidohydrolase [Tissierellia bacterium]
MNILIKNIDILDLSIDDKVIRNSNLVIVGDKIKSIGDYDKEVNYDKIIDGTNRLAMPGLVNAHSHLGMSVLRNYADDYDLNVWLNDYVWPAEAKLTDEDIYWGSLLSMVEMIQTGTTTFCDMYFSMDKVARATDESGLRGVLTRAITDIGGGGDEKFNDMMDLVLEYKNNPHDRIKFYISPHAIYTCSSELLMKCRDASLDLDIPINIHMSETLKEVKDSMASNNMTPIEYINSLGMLDAHIIAAHCTHITDEEIEIVKDKNFYPIYNPTSNLKLASGFTPIKKMLESGMTIGLGTDGSSSNNNQNMFEEIHISSIVNKAVEMNPKCISAEDSLRFATINGAKALRLDDIGELKVGNKADIVLISLDSPHMVPRYNDVSSLAYSAQGSDVETTIVNGEILMENREVKTLDVERIKYEVKKISEKLMTSR